MGNLETMQMAFPIIFFTVFALILGVIIYMMVKGIGTWVKNNNSPIVSCSATITGKRNHVSGGGNNSVAHTSYYMTFELDNKERIELRVSSSVFAMSAERDEGKLTYQGTRFKGFERKR